MQRACAHGVRQSNWLLGYLLLLSTRTELSLMLFPTHTGSFCCSFLVLILSCTCYHLAGLLYFRSYHLILLPRLLGFILFWHLIFQHLKHFSLSLPQFGLNVKKHDVGACAPANADGVVFLCSASFDLSLCAY